MADYVSESVQRTFRAIKALSGHEALGLTPGEIASAINVSASNVTRIIANLEVQKFAEEMPGKKGRYRLSASFITIANKATLGLNQAKMQIDQDIHNYSRTA